MDATLGLESLLELPNEPQAILKALPQAAKVLIIRPSALGDVCRSVPLAVSIKKALPDARIEWLVRDTCADAVRCHPSVAETVLFDRKGLGQAAGRFDPRSSLAFLGDLRQRRYDLVVDAQGLFRSGIFAWATGAKVRVGMKDAREFGWLGLNVRVAVRPGAHTVDRMLGLLEAIGIPPVRDLSLSTDSNAAQWAESHIATRSVVMAPTSIWEAKRWPIERFRMVAQRLLEDNACDQIVVVGGPGERPQCDPLLELAGSDSRVLDLVGSTSVAQLMAVIERSALVIANDSAAVHIAVGLKKPLVALYGPTKTSLVGPYQRDADVIQHTQPGDSFDHKSPSIGRPMMERITSSEVLEAAIERLASR